MNQMLLDYVIITLSEIKTTKGAFTYYIITDGGGDLQSVYAWLWKMVRELAGWPCDDRHTNEFFNKSQVFH